MTKYKVLETYTPDDPQADRRRKTVEFESDSTNIVELAIAARQACIGPSPSRVAKSNMVRHLSDSDLPGQLADQEMSGFEFLVFGNSGEWCLEVEAVN